MVFRRGCYLLLLILAHFTALGFSVVKEPARKFPLRVRRNVLQFASMIRCETGRSALDYLGYGCYCGLGGEGTPVDEVDKCCEEHDACYDRVKQSGTCFFDFYVYTNIYSRVGCSGCAPWPENNRCELAICKCDRDAARCFAKKKFNRRYKDHPDDLCEEK